MQSNKWSIAATYGLLLALVTIVYTLIQTVFAPGTAISLLLWAAKFIGSIWLLLYFIKEYAGAAEVFTYKEGFRFGFITSVFSSIIIAAYIFIHYALIFPDSIAVQMETAMTMLGSSNPDAAEQIASIEEIFPQLMFVVFLFYNSIFGAIASAIIANYTKKGDIFTESETI